jgi:hypothetical protein
VSSDRTERFIDLSALLTGFQREQLLGTGVAGQYLRTLEEAVCGQVLDDLLHAYERLPAGERSEAAVTSEILDHTDRGPVARNLIMLWYSGAWRALPDDWRRVNGASPLDTDRVVSGEAYVAGLQWVAAGAHPIGARPPGFGSWALPPERIDAERIDAERIDAKGIDA